jgi:branched-chain amino acid transport system ATP-binding protein
MPKTMLEVKDLRVHYGRIEALKGVSLHVDRGEIVALVGPNGAGKSSLLWAITGVLAPSAGAIDFEGNSLLHKSPEQIVRMGIALVPEGRQIFRSLTVEENLRLGATVRRDLTSVQRDLRELLALFPSLTQRYKSLAGNLSGGEQQQLAIARAMLGKPRLLLLDEPSLGLSPMVVELVLEAIRKLRQRGITVLLVEQMALSAVQLADRSYVFRTGTVVLAGNRAELIGNSEIAAAYLGS